jgi:hypothetical protein
MAGDPSLANNNLPEQTLSKQDPDAKVTYKGNLVDLSSLGALFAAFILVLLCLSCNMGFYCVPLIPLVLGVIGLVMARQAVDPKRTRLFSWLGIGIGGAFILMLMFAIFLYFAFLAFIIYISESGTPGLLDASGSAELIRYTFQVLSGQSGMVALL